MTVQVTSVMLGVEDLGRSKTFYADGLGCALAQDHPNFVSFDLGDGSSSLALYEREAAAADAGVPAAGSGFRGVSFHHLVATPADVDAAMAKAADAGGTIVRKAEASQWGGYFGYFSDPDGYLWKIAAPA